MAQVNDWDLAECKRQTTRHGHGEHNTIDGINQTPTSASTSTSTSSETDTEAVAETTLPTALPEPARRCCSPPLLLLLLPLPWHPTAPQPSIPLRARPNHDPGWSLSDARQTGRSSFLSSLPLECFFPPSRPRRPAAAATTHLAAASGLFLLFLRVSQDSPISACLWNACLSSNTRVETGCKAPAKENTNHIVALVTGPPLPTPSLFYLD
ncbi:hypothetical protein CPLU01_03989 [Colletotrichum plurivorum]|uniref:Uncharacterized protein n=1 Tax=Colletotrichum plurivorum TaxID=2175906 RepID=A0A8H6KS10_9PEZI|nr:hypothetical protein CPLU01_03989 [Colletotrichum plurivorum]